jgi:branched-chain amino acid aminotransferase
MFEAYDLGADTSCVVDAKGNIAEGPGFNVFMVKDGAVHTTDRGARPSNFAPG